MNDFEKLEKELSSLSPRPPTDEFTKQIEDALGEAGSVAMCHLHDQAEQSIVKSSFTKILAWTIPGIGIAAAVAFFFYFSQLSSNEIALKKWSLLRFNHLVWLMMIVHYTELARSNWRISLECRWWDGWIPKRKKSLFVE